ncbi:MAG TPA: SRPBCC domain-containing protein [Bacteriovoracaceae bacterium]|nr:SRPBCC domain-containing protein [Bacteriovoracaceae bacterium]
MSNQTVRLIRFFSTDQKNLFAHFIQSNLLKKWMTTSEMNPVAGQTYRYEVLTKPGASVCVGHFKEIKTYSHIVMYDLITTDADGKVLTTNIESKFEFIPTSGGTRISLVQTGFLNTEEANRSEFSWQHRLSRLNALFNDESSGHLESANY